MLEPGDVLIAISASGNSPNVVKAAEYARANGGTVVGLVGFTGGKLKEIADVAVPRMLRLGDELPEPDDTLTGRLRHDLMGAESRTQSLLGLVQAGERNAHRPGDHVRAGEDVMDGFVVRLGHGPNGRVHFGLLSVADDAASPPSGLRAGTFGPVLSSRSGRTLQLRGVTGDPCA